METTEVKMGLQGLADATLQVIVDKELANEGELLSDESKAAYKELMRRTPQD